MPVRSIVLDSNEREHGIQKDQQGGRMVAIILLIIILGIGISVAVIQTAYEMGYAAGYQEGKHDRDKM